MEHLLKQSRAMCPFLKKTSLSTLRALSASSSPSASAGGGTMSNLQIVARRCPVMSKAMAVQSVRNSSLVASRAFGRRPPATAAAATAAGIGLQKRSYVVPSKHINFTAASYDKAQAANIEDIHIKAGVFDANAPNKPGTSSPNRVGGLVADRLVQSVPTDKQPLPLQTGSASCRPSPTGTASLGRQMPSGRPAHRRPSSTTTASTRTNWTASTGTTRTATSTTSIAWPRSSPRPTWTIPMSW